MAIIPPKGGPTNGNYKRMGSGILKIGDPVIDFTLPEAGANTPFTLSEYYARATTVLIFYRGLG